MDDAAAPSAETHQTTESAIDLPPGFLLKATHADLKQTVELYREWGLQTVRLPARSKAPDERDWLNQPPRGPEFFAADSNVGVAVGEASGGLVDADLDWDLAIEFADVLLQDWPAFG